jgi:hypothetical protein
VHVSEKEGHYELLVTFDGESKQGRLLCKEWTDVLEKIQLVARTAERNYLFLTNGKKVRAHLYHDERFESCVMSSFLWKAQDFGMTKFGPWNCIYNLS